MMKPECPHYQPPCYGVYVDPKTGRDYDYEGSAMCNLVDKPCLVEYGEPKDCEEYMDYLTELEKEEQSNIH